MILTDAHRKAVLRALHRQRQYVAAYHAPTLETRAELLLIAETVSALEGGQELGEIAGIARACA